MEPLRVLVKEIGEPTVQYPSVSGEVCTHVLEASQTGFGVDIGLQELSQPIVPQPTFELSAGSHISDPFFIPSPQEGDFVALQEAVVPLLEPAHDHDHGPLPVTVDATHTEQRETGVAERLFPLSEPQTPLIGFGVNPEQELLHIPGFPLFVPSSHDSVPSFIPFPHTGAGGFGIIAVQEALHFPA